MSEEAFETLFSYLDSEYASSGKGFIKLATYSNCNLVSSDICSYKVAGPLFEEAFDTLFADLNSEYVSSEGGLVIQETSSFYSYFG